MCQPELARPDLSSLYEGRILRLSPFFPSVLITVASSPNSESYHLR